MNVLTCPDCQLGAMQESLVTLVYPQDGITLRISDVPAWVCSNCGKQLVTGDVAHQISSILQHVRRHAALRHLSKDVHQLRAEIAQVKSASLEMAYA